MDIDEILGKARALGCSDVHFTVGLPPVVRESGTLKQLSEYGTLHEADVQQICDSITTPKEKAVLAQKSDADFAYVCNNGFRNRVNVYWQRRSTAIAIRLLRSDIPTFNNLGLPAILSDFVMHPRGLVLVTGPTGSGKSTTLAAMIEFINSSRSSHIITIEDPIEYMHKHKKCMVNQREVGVDVNGFAPALRSALREDPDVILVGEMRDYETINMAITAAETGHLVLSTLHTSDAATTIDRIIDVFPAEQQKQIRTQLASVLVGICSQALIPKLDNSGRVACLEVLANTDAIGAMIRDNKVHMISSAIQTGKTFGMQSRDQELARMVKDRVISIDHALEHCSSTDELERFLGFSKNNFRSCFEMKTK